MAVAGPDEGVILIYFGDGKGGFTLPPKEIEDIPKNEELIAADFNSDGNMDIATTTSSSHAQDATHIDIFLGDGTGSFTLSAEVDTKPLTGALATADLNNDGKLDLVAGGAGPGNENANFISTYSRGRRRFLCSPTKY